MSNVMRILKEVIPGGNFNSFVPDSASESWNPLRHHPDPSVTVVKEVRRIRLGTSMAERQSQPRRIVSSGTVITSVRPLAHKSLTSSYWQDNGWKTSDGFLIGHYQTTGGRYRGSIEFRDSEHEPHRFYIYGPPRAILEGPHGACFHRTSLRHRSRYFIHFNDKPKNIDAGIIQIEHDLTAALKGRN